MSHCEIWYAQQEHHGQPQMRPSEAITNFYRVVDREAIAGESAYLPWPLEGLKSRCKQRMIAPTPGEAVCSTSGSGRVTRSMTPAHSLCALTGFAANDSDATCHSLPILVASSGEERLLGALRQLLQVQKQNLSMCLRVAASWSLVNPSRHLQLVAAQLTWTALTLERPLCQLEASAVAPHTCQLCRA